MNFGILPRLINDSWVQVKLKRTHAICAISTQKIFIMEQICDGVILENILHTHFMVLCGILWPICAIERSFSEPASLIEDFLVGLDSNNAKDNEKESKEQQSVDHVRH